MKSSRWRKIIALALGLGAVIGLAWWVTATFRRDQSLARDEPATAPSLFDYELRLYEEGRNFVFYSETYHPTQYPNLERWAGEMVANKATRDARPFVPRLLALHMFVERMNARDRRTFAAKWGSEFLPSGGPPSPSQ